MHTITTYMKRKVIRAAAVAAFSILALGVITDALLLFGLPHVWQYVYNLAVFFIALPAFVFTLYKTDDK